MLLGGKRGAGRRVSARAAASDVTQACGKPAEHGGRADEPARGGGVTGQVLALQQMPGAGELSLLAERKRAEQGGRFGRRKSLGEAFEKRLRPLRPPDDERRQGGQQQHLRVRRQHPQRRFGFVEQGGLMLGDGGFQARERPPAFLFAGRRFRERGIARARG